MTTGGIKVVLLKLWLVVTAVLILSVVGCDIDANGNPPDGDSNGDDLPKEEEITYDYFPYFSDSYWEFMITNRNSSNQYTYGILRFTVSSHNPDTHTSVITSTNTYPGGLSIPAEFQLRKTREGIEYSLNGSNWSKIFNQLTSASDCSFLICGPVAKPSNFSGSITRAISSSSVTTNIGNFTARKHEHYYSSYSGSYNPYNYEDRAEEYHNTDLGLIYAYFYYYDASMGYPNIISLSRKYSLKSYKIIKPDGTIIEEAEMPPDAPTNCTGTYQSTWDMGTRKFSVKIEWKDNSANENGFIVEMYTTLGAWPDYNTGFAEIASVAADTTRAFIYYGGSNMLKWPVGDYQFRVKAWNSLGESEYSNTVTVNTTW